MRIMKLGEINTTELSVGRRDQSKQGEERPSDVHSRLRSVIKQFTPTQLSAMARENFPIDNVSNDKLLIDDLDPVQILTSYADLL